MPARTFDWGPIGMKLQTDWAQCPLCSRTLRKFQAIVLLRARQSRMLPCTLIRSILYTRLRFTSRIPFIYCTIYVLDFASVDFAHETRRRRFCDSRHALHQKLDTDARCLTCPVARELESTLLHVKLILRRSIHG